jgi:NarL family two-component system response regulator LiaR
MSVSSPIRVMVVDDHEMIRHTLAMSLLTYDEFELVGQADNGTRAVDLCSQLQPQVIIMDLLMPVMDGVAATRLIHQRWPQIKIIVLSSFKDEPLARTALEVGASRYLLKNVSTEELAEAIRKVLAGSNSCYADRVGNDTKKQR